MTSSFIASTSASLSVKKIPQDASFVDPVRNIYSAGEVSD